MSKKPTLALWLICFGLSFLVQILGWTEQGKAFVYISLGYCAFSILAFWILICTRSNRNIMSEGTEIVSAAFLGWNTVGVIFIIVFAIWGFAKLINMNFYILFQIVTFLFCFCIRNKTEKKFTRELT